MTAILFVVAYGLIAGLAAFALLTNGFCVDSESRTNYNTRPWSSYTVKSIDWWCLTPAALLWPAAILWVPIAIGGRAAKKEIGAQ